MRLLALTIAFSPAASGFHAKAEPKTEELLPATATRAAVSLRFWNWVSLSGIDDGIDRPVWEQAFAPKKHRALRAKAGSPLQRVAAAMLGRMPQTTAASTSNAANLTGRRLRAVGKAFIIEGAVEDGGRN